MKYNLGSGDKPMAGYTNVDLHTDADEQWNISRFPWPIKDGSVSDLQMHHALEHLPDLHRVCAEAYRVLEVGGKWTITVPHMRGGNACCMNHVTLFTVHRFPGVDTPLVCDDTVYRVSFKCVKRRLRFWQGSDTPLVDSVMSWRPGFWEVYGWPPPQEILWVGEKRELQT